MHRRGSTYLKFKNRGLLAMMGWFPQGQGTGLDAGTGKHLATHTFHVLVWIVVTRV